MASLFKILKSISQLQHLRPKNVANIEKYFSCTPLRLGNDRYGKGKPGSDSKSGKPTENAKEHRRNKQDVRSASASKGQGASASKSQGASASKGQGASASKSHGASASKSHGASASKSQAASASKGQGASASKGQGASASKGQDASASKGQGASASKRQGYSTSKGQGASASKSQGASASKGQGASASKGQDASASKGHSASASKRQGYSTSKGHRASASKGQVYSASKGQGASASKGQGASAKKGQGYSASKGQGYSASVGQAKTTVQQTNPGDSSIVEDKVNISKVNIDLYLFDALSNEDIANVQRAEMFVAFLKGQRHRLLNTYQDYTRVYTDASIFGRVQPSKCGVGIYCEDLQIEEKLRAYDNVKAVDGELLGQLAAMKLIHKAEKKGDTRNKKYVLMTDSLTSLQCIQTPQKGERKRVIEEIASCHTQLKSLGVNVVFTWIPGHFSLHSVKKALSLAENAINKPKKEQTITRIEIPTTQAYKEQVIKNNEEGAGSGRSDIKINTENKFCEVRDSTGTPMDKFCQYIQLFKEDYGQHATVLTAIYQPPSRTAHNNIAFGVLSERQDLNFEEVISADNNAYSTKVTYVLAMKYALRAVLRQITKYKGGQQLFSPMKPKGSDKMKVLVITGSRYAIEELVYPEERKDVAEKLKTDLDRLKELNVDVIFSYMPFVWGTPGNHKADELAREAVEVNDVHPLIKDYFKNED